MGMGNLNFFQREKHSSADANSWERTFGRIKTPLERFVESATGSGILLIVLTVVALIVANTPLHEHYHHFIHQHLMVQFGDWKIDLSLHHWVNDALMAIFFYLVGLEIKYEVLVGELSSIKKAVLPIMAAVGGMLVPALMYFLINQNTPAQNGWGIPMATDIAFAMAVLLILGKRVPAALMTILVALAIVDDLGAVLVIAIFYSDGLNWAALGGALACFAVMMALSYAGMRSVWGFFVLSLVMWVLMLFSGVHATIAGVLGALATPVNSIYNPQEFSRDARKLLDRFDMYRQKEDDFMSSEYLNGVLHTLSVGIEKARTPLHRMEDFLHFPVYFLIIPLFVLFNAGVHIQFDQIGEVLSSSVTLGVALGLMLGKFIGVMLAVGLCVKLGVAGLPKEVNFLHIAGIALLAGIGFTMSIFIAELAFAGSAAHLTEAKIAILLASVCAGIAGYVVLRIAGKGRIYE